MRHDGNVVVFKVGFSIVCSTGILRLHEEQGNDVNDLLGKGQQNEGVHTLGTTNKRVIGFGH